MAFNQNDLYLASGTGQMINNWIDPVYKFDSSSFYNWEQDNLPIYDLEDRGDYLHSMAGYPASATAPTIMLAVSDCGIDNKRVFGSVSAAIEALPNTIRQPVIIEVCVSGQLGDLKLENKECIDGTGGIEIINRGFAKMMCGSGTTVSSLVFNTDDGADDGSSVYIASSLDTSNTMADTICVGLNGEPVGSKHPDTVVFWDSFARNFCLTPEYSKAKDTSQRGIAVTNNFADSNWIATNANKFSMIAYTDATTATDDIWITNYNNNTNVARTSFTRAGTAPEGPRAIGFIYNNCLSNVTVKNCSGKIYIRGFCVDGADQADITSNGSQRTNRGFDIQGSEVVIENCTATRCKESGLHAENSNVTLNRGFISYYNYELLEGVAVNDTRNTNRQTPGLRAINSDVTLSSSTVDAYGLPIDSPFTFTRNMVGIDLDNSVLKTPDGYRYGTDIAGVDTVSTNQDTLGSQTIFLQTCLNVNEGLRATQSKVDLAGYFSSFMNKVGAVLTNSTVKVAESSIDHNQSQGIVAKGSVFNYNKNAELIVREGVFINPIRFRWNGQHVSLDNSQFIPTEVSGMPGFYRRLEFDSVVGVDSPVGHLSVPSTNPSVTLNHNSYMNAVGAFNQTAITGADTTYAKYKRATKGSAFHVNNGSTLDLNGMGDNPTNIIGPLNLEAQQQCAGVYAGNGSTVNVAGPTSITQYGVDILGEDNSNINISPHMQDGVLNVSGYSLAESGDNHTKVQLHATRACVVVKGSSTVNMERLGDYHRHWDSKYYRGASTGPKEDGPTAQYSVNGITANASSCWDQGSLQFYPNPFVASSVFNISPQAHYPAVTWTVQDKIAWTAVEFPTATAIVSGISFGGMCVRAVDDSTVNAQNVTFPTGWFNTSGAYYDLSSSVCEHLRIWNIADNSQLHASYLTVSNAYPQDLSAMYWGPSALWTSDTGTGLSGAPSSTADTSGASVLDSFGHGVQTSPQVDVRKQGLGYYGKTSPENTGPFRIYVSPSAKAKFLGYPQSNGFGFMPSVGGYHSPNSFLSMGYTFRETAILRTGAPYQILAQGYNPSGDCSATNSQGATYLNPSSLYEDLGFSGYIENLPIEQQNQNDASSFFYTSAMLPNDSESRIWLDESAANTFANAKNGLLNTSGRKKIFSVYKIYDEDGGETFYGDGTSTDMARGIGSANLFDLERYL